MPEISQKKIEEIRQAADIVDVISEFVSLQPAGKSMKGLCPFHNEKTPSFSVSKERQLFNCFGCGEKGDVVGFISKYKHLNFVESLKYLADKYNIELDYNQSYSRSNNFDRYFRINELAKNFFALQLLNLETGKEGLEYLKSRNLDEHTLSYFDIGYAPKTGNLLFENLSKDFHDFELVNLGLASKGSNGYFDVFRNRIMFPIHNESGKVVGFSGRVFNNEENTGKYVNSAQTDIFIKSDILYNLDKAIPFINTNKRVVLMEGFFDVIAAHLAGVKESVCSMGTALTLNQAKLIKKYTDKVVICYDGDEAGVRATYKALILLGQIGLDVSVALMPDGNDPDDYIKKRGSESFRNLLKNNLLDQYDFVYEIIVNRRDLSKPAEIEKAKLSLFEYLHKVASSTIREIYLKKFGKDTKVDYSDILADYHHYQLDLARIHNVNRHKESIKQSDKNIKKVNKAVENASKKIINYYACFSEAREIINDKLNHIRIDNQKYRAFLMALTVLNRDEVLINEIRIKKEFNDITDEELELFRKNEKIKYSNQELIECLDTLIENEWKYEIDLINEEIVSGKLTKKEVENRVMKMQDLHSQIQNIRRKRNVKKTSN